MQVVVLKQAIAKIEQADICNQQDTPKLLRSTMTREVMLSLCEMIEPAVAYFDRMTVKYGAVVNQVPSFCRLRHRLVADGEDSLRKVFRSCYESSFKDINKMDFEESDSRSEFAFVLGKLEEALEALRKAAPDYQSQRPTSEAAAAENAATSQPPAEPPSSAVTHPCLEKVQVEAHTW